MSRRYGIFLLLVVLLIPMVSFGQTVSGPETRLVNGDLFVTLSLQPETKSVDEMKNGVDKEFRFYIDLFRIWKIWPDEFVLGKSYVRTIKVDPIKKEFIATSNDGSVLIERRFKSFESMLAWVVSIKDLKLTNVRELESAEYFVRVTIESKVRKLPPVIGYLFIFVSENEFRLVKDSPVFRIDGVR